MGTKIVTHGKQLNPLHRLKIIMSEYAIMPECEHCDKQRECFKIELIGGLPRELGYEGMNHYEEVHPGFCVWEDRDGSVTIEYTFADGSTKTDVISPDAVISGKKEGPARLEGFDEPKQ